MLAQNSVLGQTITELMKLEEDDLPMIHTLCERLGGKERGRHLEKFKKFLRNEIPSVLETPRILSFNVDTPLTIDNDGNIYFTVTSNGMTREQWERHLERRGFRFTDWGRQALRRTSEAPTNGVTYHIVVRPGIRIAYHGRVTKKIRAYAEERGWKKPHWEVACLIRDTFSDEKLEKMGLQWIVTMHEPVTDSVGDPRLLDSDRNHEGPQFHASSGRLDNCWHDGGGFAFAVPQVGSQT